MIAIDPGFAASLTAQATTLAICWRIVRPDGVAIGLTAHDAPITTGGVTYQPSPGCLPSAITLGQPGEASAIELMGALTPGGITETDLASGRYDGASARCQLIDWENPAAGALTLAEGTLGQVTVKGGALIAEVRTALADLARSPVETYSPTCRAALGDARCRVNLALWTLGGHVTAVSGVSVGTDLPGGANNAYQYGRARVLSGPAAGAETRIDGSAAGQVTLFAPIVGLAPGNRIELRAGCDKRFATCRDTFGNIGNFRGEPHVPGEDLISGFAGR